MFNSTIVDVVVGLVGTFLAISLIASALTEALATALSLRATTLLNGIKQLLNDPGLNGLAGDLYNHALVNPFSDGKTADGATPTSQPSYIDAQHFAIALIDGIQQTAGQAATLGDAIDKIEDDQIRATLAALYKRAGNDADAFRNQVAQWFNTAMDRLSGSYKRWTKVVTFVVALAAAALLNADPVRLAETLWQRPAVAAQLAKVDFSQANAAQPAVQAVQLIGQIENAGPLLGWSGFEGSPRDTVLGWALMVVGWLITAGAAMFGAPFWFDILQRIVQLRGTGRPIGTVGASAPTAAPAPLVTFTAAAPAGPAAAPGP
jgi:hypothetical protein